MSIENLKNSLPEYAKDQKLNLGTLVRSTELNEEQLWGSLLAAAAATRNDTVPVSYTHLTLPTKA